MKAIFYMVLAAAALVGLTAATGDSVCATVKIEIRQDLTLERQAFEAKMRINNGLTGIPLTDVAVTLSFADADRRPVTFTVGDTYETNALFFVRNPTLANIGSVTAGTVAGGTGADIEWLIIPNPGAANDNPDGTLYYVGATLSYKLQGEAQTMTVSPDTIYVKPMPYLALDYFLPGQVYGDDAFTTGVIEPAVPFPLGLRIRNVGKGTAQSVRIDSGQPEIVANTNNLLVGFRLTEGAVDGAAISPSLLLDYGSISPGASRMGFWRMEVTLSGTFTRFEADISHSDELGGQVTSLINPTNVNTHLIIKDMQVDLPGRDGVVDFLGADLTAYESDGMDTTVSSVGRSASPISGNTCQMSSASGPTGFVYSAVVDNQYNPDVRFLKGAVRSDGKVMNLKNVWLSKRRPGAEEDWEYSLNLFDTEGANFSYTLTFDDATNVNRAPVFQYMPNKKVAAGKNITFLAVASDDGGAPQLSASALPGGAGFLPAVTNAANNYAAVNVGQLKATAQPFYNRMGMTNSYPWSGTVASNDYAIANIGQAKNLFGFDPYTDTDTDGMPDWWEELHGLNKSLAADADSDKDSDGVVNLQEFLNATTP